ncbi:MAG: prolyl oligopeptidase family serine peptidase [Acidobacteria bacterium]|nr:prolyl oligopeptidase family serine peptidase [Acidobacteriota bacterium]
MENKASRRRAALLVAVLAGSILSAQDRPVPPPGVTVSENDRKDLEGGLKRLSDSIHSLGRHALLPDVTIFREAVRYALTYNEFFDPPDIPKAKALLVEGQKRADQLLRGEAPWVKATGLVVRGYVSKIDGSVQPYGLVVPPSFDPSLPRRWRVDFWFHGRAEKLSEVNFLAERMARPGEFTPADTIVVHLYGRYCNANKFAGEVDLFETLDALRKQYPVDEDRILVRGFSMGGAAAWHFGAHHAGRWAAVAPGAGFSESAEFLRLARNNEQTTPWEQTLWRMYDATVYAANFTNVPLVAYSGEIDGQKQAADLMEKYLEKEGIPMTHIIGPQTPHRYHPDSRVEIDRRLDAIAARGRDAYPRRVKFVTYTLRYNRMKWVAVAGMEKHWEKATVDASIHNKESLQVTTSNVSALTIDFGPGGAPVELVGKAVIAIDGQSVPVTGPSSDRSWTVHLAKSGGKWAVAPGLPEGKVKRHGLQGPIDDAFMNSFLFVIPSGTPTGEAGKRISEEQERAIREWRRQFRGDARVKRDSEVTEADIAAHNLVLWGDPASNSVMAKVMGGLPVQWSGDSLTMKGQKYSAATNYPALIYPNPLNAKKYVVLNSGFTFREFDNLNNARQISKLPDWAVIDVTTPANGRYPGKVTAAGFFNEQWQ